MNTCPTPEQWREHAAHARQIAETARAIGDHAYADRREGDAEFYERQAVQEERLIACRRRRHVLEVAA